MTLKVPFDPRPRPRGDYDEHTPAELARELLVALLHPDSRGPYIQASRDLLMACHAKLEKAAAFDAMASGLRQLIKAVQS